MGCRWERLGRYGVGFRRIGSRPLHNVFTGQKVRAQEGKIRLEELFDQFPVALLTGF